jgi:hypothetical protein
MMQTILQTSAMMPAIKEMMKAVDLNALTGALSRAVQAVDPGKVAAAEAPPVNVAPRIPERHDDAH